MTNHNHNNNPPSSTYVAHSPLISHYHLLSTPHNSTPDQITRAYKLAIRKWHPDRHPSATEAQQKEITTKAQQIINAHQTLIDPVTRREYDDWCAGLEGGFSEEADPGNWFWKNRGVGVVWSGRGSGQMGMPTGTATGWNGTWQQDDGQWDSESEEEEAEYEARMRAEAAARRDREWAENAARMRQRQQEADAAAAKEKAWEENAARIRQRREAEAAATVAAEEERRRAAAAEEEKRKRAAEREREWEENAARVRRRQEAEAEAEAERLAAEAREAAAADRTPSVEPTIKIDETPTRGRGRAPTIGIASIVPPSAVKAEGDELQDGADPATRESSSNRWWKRTLGRFRSRSNMRSCSRERKPVEKDTKKETAKLKRDEKRAAAEEKQREKNEKLAREKAAKAAAKEKAEEERKAKKAEKQRQKEEAIKEKQRKKDEEWQRRMELIEQERKEKEAKLKLKELDDALERIEREEAAERQRTKAAAELEEEEDEEYRRNLEEIVELEGALAEQLRRREDDERRQREAEQPRRTAEAEATEHSTIYEEEDSFAEQRIRQETEARHRWEEEQRRIRRRQREEERRRRGRDQAGRRFPHPLSCRCLDCVPTMWDSDLGLDLDSDISSDTSERLDYSDLDSRFSSSDKTADFQRRNLHNRHSESHLQDPTRNQKTFHRRGVSESHHTPYNHRPTPREAPRWQSGNTNHKPDIVLCDDAAMWLFTFPGGVKGCNIFLSENARMKRYTCSETLGEYGRGGPNLIVSDSARVERSKCVYQGSGWYPAKDYQRGVPKTVLDGADQLSAQVVTLEGLDIVASGDAVLHIHSCPSTDKMR